MHIPGFRWFEQRRSGIRGGIAILVRHNLHVCRALGNEYAQFVDVRLKHGACAHLLMLTCLPPITLVEGASLNKGYEIHVWRLYSALISRVMYSLGGISMLVQGASHLYWRVTLTPIGFLLTCQCALGVRG